MTCGEFVQGVGVDGPFLISCPIDLCGSAVCTRSDSTGHIRVVPDDRLKTAQALRLLMSQGDLRAGLEVRLANMAPIGRGYGSSTADIAAGLAAAATVLGIDLTVDAIGRLATSVEPTDGSFAPGLVVFDHVHGERSEMLGDPPAGYVLVADPGYEMETADVHRDLGPGIGSAEANEALEMVRAGVAARDLGLIGKGSTLSAHANQTRLPNPLLQRLELMAPRCSGAGLIVAHSGTIAGILFADADAASHGRAVATLSLGSGVALRVCRLRGGGIDIATPADDSYRHAFETSAVTGATKRS
jgi:L-threonine kinase